MSDPLPDSQSVLAAASLSVPATNQPAMPVVPNSSEVALLWLAIGLASLFVAYLIMDWFRCRLRKRLLDRRWEERAHAPIVESPVSDTVEPPPAKKK